MIVKFEHLPVVSIENAGVTPAPRSVDQSGMDSGLDLSGGMQFGDVLSSQDGAPLVFDEILHDPTVIEGGKIVQPGGKVLPDLSESEPLLEPLDPLEALGLEPIVPDTPISNLGVAERSVIDSEQAKRIANQFVVTSHFSLGEPVGVENSFKNAGVLGRPIVVNSGSKDAPLPLSGNGNSKDGVLAQQVQEVLDAGLTSVDKPDRLNVGEQIVSKTYGLGQTQTQAQPQTQAPASTVQLFVNEPDMLPTSKPVSNLPITVPLKDFAWSGEFVGRMSLMVKGGLQEASIQLNPPELGRMEVKLSTDGDQVKIMFTVQHAAAREAIEQAMPRLREMLEQSGLQLAQSDVADQSQSQRRENKVEHNPSTQFVDEQKEEVGESVAEINLVSSDSIVDYYI